MSLKIRMSRGGTKKRPFYSIVVADSRMPRDGRFIEKLGFHNPLMPKDHADRTKLDLEKAKAWMAKGATPSDRVHRLLAEAGVLKPLKAQQSRKGEAEKEASGTRSRRRCCRCRASFCGSCSCGSSCCSRSRSGNQAR